MRAAAILTVIGCAIVSAVAVVLLRGAGNHLTASAIPSPSNRIAASVAPSSPTGASANARQQAGRPPRSQMNVGVVSYNLPQFEKVAGVYPSIDVKYIQWGSQFPAAEVRNNHGLGITMILVLEPSNTSLAGIADGADDAYLRSWGRADGELGLPVILSFAPEANGSWYQWGAGHITPKLYQEMWRRVHEELTVAGARQVTWLWQVSSVWATSEPLSLLWPGDRYVTEAGIDGQLGNSAATFSSVFSQTVAQIRDITRKPIMLSEVAVNKSPARPAQITSLFNGARGDDLSALVLFDVHPRWQFDDDPAALDAFRKGAEAAR